MITAALPQKMHGHAVAWLTPQQVDAERNRRREEEALNRSTVKVREIPAQLRPASMSEEAENQHILADARRIMAVAIKSGAAEVHPQPGVRPWQIAKQGQRSQKPAPAIAVRKDRGMTRHGKPDRRCGPRSAEHRAKQSVSIKAAVQFRKQQALNSQPATLNS